LPLSASCGKFISSAVGEKKILGGKLPPVDFARAGKIFAGRAAFVKFYHSPFMLDCVVGKQLPQSCATAVLKPPQSRRCATNRVTWPARSVSTAAVDRRFRPPEHLATRKPGIVRERQNPLL
jgi:hypothetical protein